MPNEQTDNSDSQLPPIDSSSPGQWDNEAHNNPMEAAQEQASTNATPQAQEQIHTIVIEREQEKWHTRDTVQTIAAAATVIAIFIALWAGCEAKRANKISQDSLDSASKASRENYNLTVKIFEQAKIDGVKKDSSDSAKYIDTRKDIEKTLAISKTNAEASIKGTDINSKAFKFNQSAISQQIRAYLYLDSVFIDGDTPEKLNKIDIRIRNYGETPAYNVVIRGQGGFIYNEKEKFFDWMDTKANKKTGVAIAAKDNLEQRLVLMNLTQKNFDDFKVANIDFFISIVIEYTDVFNKPHRTRILSQMLFNWGELHPVDSKTDSY